MFVVLRVGEDHDDVVGPVALTLLLLPLLVLLFLLAREVDMMTEVMCSCCYMTFVVVAVAEIEVGEKQEDVAK